MTESEMADGSDEELIAKHLPDGAESYVEKSLFTKRELVAYLLWKRTDMTFAEAGEAMGITYGTFSGKTHAVEGKKEKAEATLELVKAVEG